MIKTQYNLTHDHKKIVFFREYTYFNIIYNSDITIYI